MSRFCLALAWFCLAVPAFSQTDVVLPWVTHNENYQSTIAVNNLNPVTAVVRLKATRAEGAVGQAEEEVELSLAAFEQKTFTAGELFSQMGEGSGYAVRVTSALSDIAPGFLIGATSTDSGFSPAQSGSFDVSTAKQALLFEYVRADQGNTAPVVVNLGDREAQVAFKWYREGHQIGETVTRQIPAGKPHAELISSLFPGISGEGFITAEAEVPLAGSGFFFNAQGEPSMALAKALQAAPRVKLSDYQPEENPEYRHFESDQVRPLALSPDGTLLFAANTPADRLEVFRFQEGRLTPLYQVPVGMRPVAVAARSNSEVWVVNHLSDSVSIVSIGEEGGRVERTLHVGDEPRDIVFAGSDQRRAFITTAHRGQNIGFDPQFFTPSIGRADVWVFDPDALGNAMGGQPVKVFNLFGDTPRALAVSADQTRVYAAVFHSGNKTTALRFPDEKDGPRVSVDGRRAPETGLIVRYENGRWLDDNGNQHHDTIKFTLPDYDVFAIDADSLQEIQRYSGVGTTLYNLAVNPVDGTVYVSNTEAHNLQRYLQNARGRFVDNRITLLDGNGGVFPRDLNKHIDYSQDLGSQAEKQAALATPNAMVVDPSGETLYVAALGSDKIGVFATNSLADDSFQPDSNNHILLSGGAPSGLTMDPSGRYLFVYSRVNNGISLVDTTQFAEIAHHVMENPEPEVVRRGRRFLYDAKHASSRGNLSCASCHIFGDTDNLAWDLSDLEGVQVDSPNRYVTVAQFNKKPYFHPFKGPLMTQSLRGLVGAGPLHWRGDRTGVQRAAGETKESAAFKEFNESFVSLLGRETEISDEEMEQFKNFVMAIEYAPNPIRNLDNTLTSRQQAGKTFYINGSPGNVGCEPCHRLNPATEYYGSSGLMSDDGPFNSQDFKVPHFRNQYQKVGLFGSPSPYFSNIGPQIRGFGYTHDGVVSTLETFLEITFPNIPQQSREDAARFVLVMDNQIKPIVGQQVTPRTGSGAEWTRLDIMIGQQNQGNCRIKVGGQNGESLIYENGTFRSERDGQTYTLDQLKAQTNNGNRYTFTAHPPQK